MGMFTTIIHPIDGHELQIKTGNDWCEVLRVGDKVDWKIDEYSPMQGYMLDGVYAAYVPEEKKCHEMVVVKDHKVYAIVCVPSHDDKGEYIGEGFVEYQLRRQFGIKTMPRSAWTKSAWALERFYTKKFKGEHAAFEKTIAKLSVKVKRARRLLHPISMPLYDQEPDPVALKLMEKIDREVAQRKGKQK